MAGPALKQDDPFKATLAAVVDRVTGRQQGVPLTDGDRLDGRTALVTGGNRGLGRAVAADLARRGGRVLLACRSGLPRAADELARETGGDVVGERVDLGDLEDVARFCDGLRDRGERVDVAVLNAGVVPATSRRTRQGFEEMLQVNYLANVLLIRRLLEDGVIPNRAFAGREPATPRARIVFVSSESHRSAEPVPPASLGDFQAYGMGGSVAAYGRSKWLLETLTAELARRLAGPPGEPPDVAVHSLCPGAVATGIAREAPPWAKPLLGVVMKVFFRPPADAASPVVYLAAGRAVEGRTGVYLHVTVDKSRAETAADASTSGAIWARAEELLDPWLPSAAPSRERAPGAAEPSA